MTPSAYTHLLFGSFPRILLPLATFLAVIVIVNGPCAFHNRAPPPENTEVPPLDPCERLTVYTLVTEQVGETFGSVPVDPQ